MPAIHLKLDGPEDCTPIPAGELCPDCPHMDAVREALIASDDDMAHRDESEPKIVRAVVAERDTLRRRAEELEVARDTTEMHNASLRTELASVKRERDTLQRQRQEASDLLDKMMRAVAGSAGYTGDQDPELLTDHVIRMRAVYEVAEIARDTIGEHRPATYYYRLCNAVDALRAAQGKGQGDGNG